MDIKDIASNIRKELKQAYKGYKFSVRLSRYSGGQSLNVTIKSVPEGTQIISSEWIREFARSGQWPTHINQLTDEMEKVQEGVEAISNAYNFDKSDISYDYFHVNYYCFVNFCYDLTRTERDRMMAELEEA